MHRTKAIILGCGSSGGVPRIGNDWGVCDPDNPKNRRSRCSLFLEVTSSDETSVSLLIDTAPELREQLIRNEISKVDAVLYTHSHADQCHGIDDLRVLAYRQQRRMPVYGSETSLDELRERFGYCFRTPEGSPYPPILDARPSIEPNISFDVSSEEGGTIEVLPLDQDHGSVRSLAFRVGNLAYCNDVVNIPDESLAQLNGLDVLIVDALRYDPHPTHAHVGKALEWIDRLQPNTAILTNLHIDLDYDVLSRDLPKNVFPAFDGMTVGSNYP
jgi:phosphoribosyl 1,2-cyclic phosphate phosphodiesterase